MFKRVRLTNAFFMGIFAVAAGVVMVMLVSRASAREIPFPTQHIVDDYTYPYALYASDVDLDGDIDILSASADANDISWWENDGTPDSGWVAHSITNTLSGAAGVTVADVNGDGAPDVLGTAYFARTIVWWASDGIPGDGGWVTHVISDAIEYPEWVRANDLDSDGDIDILVTLRQSTVDIAWWENTASDGTSWLMHTVTDAIGVAWQVQISDVDGDGDRDIVSISDEPGLVAWWENTSGDGAAWTSHAVDATIGCPGAVYPADADGDGDIDIFASDMIADMVYWWENTDGDGTAWIEHALHSSVAIVNAVSLTVIDMDRDGDVDVLFDNGGRISWWDNIYGDGSMWTPRLTLPDLDTRLSYPADVDNDGDIDIVGANIDNIGDQIHWWENETIHRNATFPVKETVEDNLPVWDVHTTDMDSDGDLDVLGAATTHTGTPDGMISWWRNNDGIGTNWTEFIVLDTEFNGAVAIRSGDLDGDGDQDFLAAGWQGRAVAWWENASGTGSVLTRRDLDTDFPAPYSVAIADVDNDGDLDALAGGDPEIAWWENNGTTTGWTEHQVFYEHAHVMRKIEAVDVDRDGDVDVVGACSGKGYLAWWENDGTGSGWTVHDISGGILLFNGTPSVHTADLNGDGDLDVIGSHSDEYDPVDIAWFENDGSGGGWIKHTIETLFNGADGLYAIDFDLDGDLDLASASGDQFYGLAWWENTAGDGLTWTIHTVVSSFGGRNLHAADIDGDGDPDLLGAETNAGDVVLWHNRGGQFALETTNTTPGGMGQGEMDDMLRVKMTHNGRTGDHDEELATLELLFEESAGDPLTTAEANTLIEALHIYVDDGTQIFDPAWDTLVTTVETLDLSAGVQMVTLPDGSSDVQVTLLVYKTFFVVPELTANAHQQTPSQFRITHLTESSSTAEDRDHDIALLMAYTEDTTSGAIALTNHMPNAVDDDVSTPEDTAKLITVTGNDTDQDGDPLFVITIAQSLHGSATISGTAYVIYTPAPNYYGADNFDYTVSDGVLTDTAVVYVTVTPVNDPPNVETGGNQTVDEGGQVDFAGGFTDPDTGDSHTITWVFGDGDAMSGTLTPSHSYNDDGAYTVSLTVDDHYGGVVSDTLTVTVANVAPTLALSGPAAVDEGGTYTLTLSAVADPGDDTVTACTVDWGDGAYSDCLAALDGTLTHIYADGPLSPTITLDLVDEDGNYEAVDSLAISVNNADPVLDAGADQDAYPGDIVTVLASFTDPGITDIHTATIQWGDGDISIGIVDQEAGAVTGTHAYIAPKTYTVTITLYDGDGGQTSDAFAVTVRAYTIYLPGVMNQENKQ